MNSRRTFPVLSCLALWLGFGAPGSAFAAQSPAVMPFIGGVGGVYLYPEPGELVIEVEKQDLNRREGGIELRAILAGPDRSVLQEVVIPDDGKPRSIGRGPTQSARLSARVERRGVYVLNVTTSQDRYGEKAVWRVRTNCARYLIETARGHKDARHEEPIVLASPGHPGEVCFWPRTGSFRLELSRLPRGTAAPELFDSAGQRIASITVNPSGEGRLEVIAATSPRAGPWRLHLPAAQATLQIDGLTRWDKNDPLPDACLWSPDLAAWFPLPENRWLLTPYRRTVFGHPGERRSVSLDVRNNSSRARTMRFTVEFPATTWPVQLSDEQVTLAPHDTKSLSALCVLPPADQSRAVHVRVTPLDDVEFSTYATVTATARPAPASQPLSLPITLQAYRHENEQFGYLPDYPLDNQMYFDARHRPYVRTNTGVATWADGKWITSVIDPRSTAAGTKISFDHQHRAYLLATVGSTASLHVSTDGGRTFAATVIPSRERPARSFDLEEFTGHNPLAGPPPVLRYTQTAKDEKLFWRSLNDLELFLPHWENDGLVMGPPILITQKCIGLASHSGIPASVVSRGDKVHVIWGEATDPAAKVAGVPACVATYDRATGRLGERVVLGYGAPANDIHNSPSITMDRAGFLHALGGTHGRPFPYAQSRQANDANGGWTDAMPTGEGVNQTYIGLVGTPDDTLHAVFRLWRNHLPPFPQSMHATLAYQRKRPGQPWEAPRVLVVSPFSEYSVFYHRLTLDRRGRLLLSYEYWSTFWFYRNDLPHRRRAVLLSPDGGTNWRFAATGDFAPPDRPE